jgi:hypothetical protein
VQAQDGTTWDVGIGVIKYTRSRDALKAIRPEEWYIDLTQRKHWNEAIVGHRPSNTGSLQEVLTSPRLPTEELAELHAIIQAIEYERSQLQSG